MILSIFIYHHIQVGVWCQVVARLGVPAHPFSEGEGGGGGYTNA